MKPVSSTAGRWMLLLGCAVGAAACSEAIVPPPACALVGIPVTPSSANVRPGDSTTFRVTGPGFRCGVSSIANPTWRWSSTNTRIATIDSVTGVAIGRDTGHTTLIVHAKEDPEMQSAAVIVVRP